MITTLAEIAILVGVLIVVGGLLLMGAGWVLAAVREEVRHREDKR